MNNITFVQELIENRFPVRKTEIVDAYQIAFEVNKDDVHPVLSTLKAEGWIQLSYLSAIDWREDGEFESFYTAMNWTKPVNIQVRTRIPRDEPSMNTILPVFPGAKYYERECHEFFGVNFPGNPDYQKPLIMEDWDDIPPLRKDFDPRAYSDAHFPKRDYGDRYTNLNNQDSKQAKRVARRNRSAAVGKGGRM